MRKVLRVSLLVFFLLSFLYGTVQAQPRTIFRRTDPKGDDYGAGKLVYPAHDVFVEGLFDLEEFRVDIDSESIYFNFIFMSLTNPFKAPEGYFHQRLDVYINLESEGNSLIQFGNYKLKTSPQYGWQVRLVVAPFGETFIQMEREGERWVSSEKIKSQVLKDGRTISVQVDKSMLPEPDESWRYYVLVGSFDGLAPGLLRDLGVDSWQLGGEGVPIFDILAPRWGSKSQKRQLTQGILYPVGPKDLRYLELVIVFIVFVLLVLMFLLWRWYYGRT